MRIVSRNSMTYLPCFSFFGRFLNITKKCQSKSHVDQYYLYGIRYFDIRISFSGEACGHIIFKNGLVTYKTFSFHEVMQFFNTKEDCHVRLTLDTTGQKNKQELRKHFTYLCSLLEESYSNIAFFGGTETNSLEHLYLFKYEHETTSLASEDIFDHGRSTFETWISFIQRTIYNISPWLHAILFNKWIRKTFFRTDRLVTMDFINHS